MTDISCAHLFYLQGHGFNDTKAPWRSWAAGQLDRQMDGRRVVGPSRLCDPPSIPKPTLRPEARGLHRSPRPNETRSESARARWGLARGERTSPSALTCSTAPTRAPHAHRRVPSGPRVLVLLTSRTRPDSLTRSETPSPPPSRTRVVSCKETRLCTQKSSQNRSSVQSELQKETAPHRDGDS